MDTARSSQLLGRVVPLTTAWRQNLCPTGVADGTYKEWMHFCIRLPGPPAGHLLVNLSLVDRGEGTAATRTARLMVLARVDEWTGLIRSFGAPAAEGNAGTPDIRLGPNSLCWQDHGFRLRLDEQGVQVDIFLRPLVLPTSASLISLGQGQAMYWSALPRLEATGWARIANRRQELNRVLAYQDHNWGHFRWGAGLGWEWGFVNPTDVHCPWSLVFLRISDGHGHRTLSQAMLLWQGVSLKRTFQNRELSFQYDGSHREDRPYTLPRLARLLSPAVSLGVPARLSIQGRSLATSIELSFRAETMARIALPSESDDLGLVTLNETSGTACVSGNLAGEIVDLEGPTVAEFVRG